MWFPNLDKIRISAGFWLLVSWFGVINGWELLAVVLGAAILHELGHMAVLRVLGAEILEIQINVLGASMKVDDRRLSYGGELAATLAGPGVNLISAAVLSKWGLETAVGAHLILGAFNLLPVRPLDGGRALWLLAAMLFGPMNGERIARCVGMIASLGLTMLLGWLMICTGGSLWLAPAALGFLACAGRESSGKGTFL